MRIFKFLLVVTAAVSILTIATPVLAAGSYGELPTGEASGPYIGLEMGAGTGLGNRDLRISTSLVIRAAMGLLGIAATVIVLIGGYTWMTAGGNDEKIGEAKKWMFAGVIGLAIIFSAYSISNFVLDRIIKSTINTGFTNE